MVLPGGYSEVNFMMIYEEGHTLTMTAQGVSGMTYTATDTSIALGFMERATLLLTLCSSLAESNNDEIRPDEIVVAQDFYDIEELAQQEALSQRQSETADYLPNNTDELVAS